MLFIATSCCGEHYLEYHSELTGDPLGEMRQANVKFDDEVLTGKVSSDNTQTYMFCIIMHIRICMFVILDQYSYACSHTSVNTCPCSLHLIAGGSSLHH